jgi:guanosine-3',5'-bis(diphosphate) 3'-pyrophosphohydrolase
MSGKSRVQFFEQRVADAGQDITLRALDFVKTEMSAAKGFARHDGSDYFEHCVDVAQDLWNHGIKDQTIISAALLHDTEEDIPGVTEKMLAHEFTPEIAHLVHALTKRPDIDYKSGDNIKTFYLDPMLDDGRKIVLKAGDRKHNFSTLRDASPEKKLRQAIETETYFFPFWKEGMKLYPRYAAYLLSAKTAIKPHLLAIKDHHAEMEEMKAKYSKLAEEYNQLAKAYDSFRSSF